jgi:5-formyltetrahydrofolate cyclo-ligase
MPKDPARIDLREGLLARRRALTGQARTQANVRLVAALKTLLQLRFGPLDRLSVGAYLPIGAEPDITSMFPLLGAVALPQVEDAARPLRFLSYRLGMPLKTEGFGVQVPIEHVEVLPSILLIPCVGYHVRGDGRIDRLGYGGGFYDRTLAAGSYATIGIAFSIARMATFQAQAHDVPLDTVVTDTTTADPT